MQKYKFLNAKLLVCFWSLFSNFLILLFLYQICITWTNFLFLIFACNIENVYWNSNIDDLKIYILDIAFVEITASKSDPHFFIWKSTTIKGDTKKHFTEYGHPLFWYA